MSGQQHQTSSDARVQHGHWHSNLRQICTKSTSWARQSMWCIAWHIGNPKFYFILPLGKQADACRCAVIFQSAWTVQSHGTYLDQCLVIFSFPQPPAGSQSHVGGVGYSLAHTMGEKSRPFSRNLKVCPLTGKPREQSSIFGTPTSPSPCIMHALPKQASRPHVRAWGWSAEYSE